MDKATTQENSAARVLEAIRRAMQRAGMPDAEIGQKLDHWRAMPEADMMDAVSEWISRWVARTGRDAGAETTRIEAEIDRMERAYPHQYKNWSLGLRIEGVTHEVAEEGMNRLTAYIEDCGGRVWPADVRGGGLQLQQSEHTDEPAESMGTRTAVARLRVFARRLERTVRYGAERDEPEGSRWIQISDTMAGLFARQLRAMADQIPELDAARDRSEGEGNEQTAGSQQV